MGAEQGHLQPSHRSIMCLLEPMDILAHWRFSFLLLCSALLFRSKKQTPVGAAAFGEEEKKKDDEDTSALFQIVHFLCPCTVCKQAIKYRTADLRLNK